MTNRIEIAVGQQLWPVTLSPDRLVELRRPSPAPEPAQSPRELVRAALERPFEFEPLRRAVTPDDHVVIALDSTLPHLAELIAGVLDHLGTAGVRPEAVTLLTAPGADQNWIDDLPDEFADVRTETHDPADRKRLAYLAATKAGRRVYLNRTLVEADFVILLTGRRFDPVAGHAGAEGVLFPPLSDEESRAADRETARGEAAEVGWLVGTPFLVQVIEGAGDAVQEVVAGLAGSRAEGARRQDARWQATVDTRPDTVIAAVSGDPARVTFADLAAAAGCAAAVVAPGGRVVVLSAAAPAAGEEVDAVRGHDDAAAAAKALTKHPAASPTPLRWATAAKSRRLFLASGWDDHVTEDLYATPIRTPSELQRLADAAERLLIIPDAHKMRVELA